MVGVLGVLWAEAGGGVDGFVVETLLGSWGVEGRMVFSEGMARMADIVAMLVVDLNLV